MLLQKDADQNYGYERVRQFPVSAGEKEVRFEACSTPTKGFKFGWQTVKLRTCPLVHGHLSKHSFLACIGIFSTHEPSLRSMKVNLSENSDMKTFRNSVSSVDMLTGKTELLACDDRLCTVISLVYMEQHSAGANLASRTCSHRNAH